jgi:hypothetical protein
MVAVTITIIICLTTLTALSIWTSHKEKYLDKMLGAKDITQQQASLN